MRQNDAFADLGYSQDVDPAITERMRKSLASRVDQVTPERTCKPVEASTSQNIPFKALEIITKHFPINIRNTEVGRGQIINALEELEGIGYSLPPKLADYRSKDFNTLYYDHYQKLREKIQIDVP